MAENGGISADEFTRLQASYMSYMNLFGTAMLPVCQLVIPYETRTEIMTLIPTIPEFD